MDFLTLITIIGGVILTIGYIPQLFKLHKTGDTHGINNGFWYLVTTTVAITAVNLIVDSAPLVLIIIQVINAALAGIVLITVHFYRKEYKQMVYPTFLIVAIILLAGVVLPIEITQTVASISIVVAYVSQLITLFKAPSVSGVAPSLYLLIAVGLGIMATKMFVTDVTPYIIATELINIALLLTCACVSFYFQWKGAKTDERRARV